MSPSEPPSSEPTLCVPRQQAEPVVAAERLAATISPEDVARFRPLLPIGYRGAADAYRRAAAELRADHLSEQYALGLAFFHEEVAPHVRRRVEALSGGAWNLEDFLAYGAGSDVDLITHVVNGAAAMGERLVVHPGDWHGFAEGASQPGRIELASDASEAIACLCVPSVRNGHLTQEMLTWLASARACLLDINLYPTLTASERHATAAALTPLLPKTLLSVSFSRGFGLTASHLGVLLVHRDHPLRQRFHDSWHWLTRFYNQLAARAFMAIDLEHLQSVDTQRRAWVEDWLFDHELPMVDTGSYYVKSFRVTGELPPHLQPLERVPGLVRLCFRPAHLV